MKLTLYDFLRAGHVKRWHIVNTVTQQSIAEHSYLVAIIAMHIHRWVQPAGDVEPMETGIYALFHDAPEIRTGDIPTPAKRLLRETERPPTTDFGPAEMDLFERLDFNLLPECPFIPGGEAAEISIMCVRMADAIEAAHWIRENGAGRHAEIVAAGCWRRVEDLVHQFHTTQKDADWYGAVNHVMMALGMPYVSQEERISPP
jgi:5'-deoxynucleotidase